MPQCELVALLTRMKRSNGYEYAEGGSGGLGKGGVGSTRANSSKL